MADRQTVAFTKPQVQQLRKLLHVTRDETAGGGGRRPRPAASSAYNGQFAVTDITDYSPLQEEPPGSISDYKLKMLGGQAHFLNRVNTVAEREEVEFEWESETEKYLVLEFSLDGATVVVEEKVLTLAETQAALGADEGRLVIAKLTLADSRITVEQIQFGSATVVSSGYNGMFKVTDTTDYSPLFEEPPGAVTYQVTIAAGIAQCESKFVSVAIEEDMELTTQTGYLTLEFDVDVEDGAITQEYKLETLGNVTADLDLYKGRCIIAQIEKPDDRLVITQLQHNIALVSIRTPEVPEEEEE
jgi:hypothetical protein